MALCYHCSRIANVSIVYNGLPLQLCNNCFNWFGYSSVSATQPHNCPQCNILTWGIGNPQSPISPLCSICYITKLGTTQNIRVPIQTKEPEMREATLIYEESIQSYCFQFTKGFNKSVVDIIKAGIPTNERTTTGPPDWKWYFAEKYFNLVKLALDGAGFKIKIITKEDIEKLRQEQAKHQEEAQQYYIKTVGISIGDELQKFRDLLLKANILKVDPPLTPMRVIENWNKEEAIRFYRKAAQFYHPDRNPQYAASMSELNSTWAVLKDAYYIK